MASPLINLIPLHLKDIEAALERRPENARQVASAWKRLFDDCRPDDRHHNDQLRDLSSNWAAILHCGLVEETLRLVDLTLQLEAQAGTDEAHAANGLAYGMECLYGYLMYAEDALHQTTEGQNCHSNDETIVATNAVVDKAPALVWRWWVRYRHLVGDWIQQRRFMEYCDVFAFILERICRIRESGAQAAEQTKFRLV